MTISKLEIVIRELLPWATLQQVIVLSKFFNSDYLIMDRNTIYAIIDLETKDIPWLYCKQFTRMPKNIDKLKFYLGSYIVGCITICLDWNTPKISTV